MGVERFIHLSALGANPNPDKGFFVGRSEFLRTKGLGEIAVRFISLCKCYEKFVRYYSIVRCS